MPKIRDDYARFSIWQDQVAKRLADRGDADLERIFHEECTALIRDFCDAGSYFANFTKRDWRDYWTWLREVLRPPDPFRNARERLRAMVRRYGTVISWEETA